MKRSSTFSIPLAILLGALVGLWTGTETTLFGIPLIRVYTLLGQLFLNALTYVVIPLVITSMISAACRLGKQEGIASLGKRTLLTFFFVSLLAAFTGGLFLSLSSSWIPTASFTPLEPIQKVSLFDTIEQMALNLVPSNFFATAAEGKLLGLLGFCLLFGAFIPRIEKTSSAILFNFFNGCFLVLMEMTKLIMKILPLGAFALVAKASAETGFDALSSAMWFFSVTVAALITFSLALLPLLLKLFSRVSPFSFYASIGPALATAFTTSSSAASLPTLLECMEEKTQLQVRVFGMTIPLGATMSLAGTALYIAAVTVFIAHISHFPLPIEMLLIVILLATITSMGMAGIPSASLVSIIVILQTLGLPKESLGIILAVERFLDMCRTCVNVMGNASCAAMISSAFHPIKESVHEA